MNKKNKSQVVVETPEFIKQAKLCMEDEARTEFVSHIAFNPKDGDLIVGTGGARKIRWSCGNDKGKSGGVRIIYYFHNEGMPIFLFTVYGKNKKANVSQDERNILKSIIQSVVHAYGENDYE